MLYLAGVSTNNIKLKAEFINTPTSGIYEQIHFGDSSSNCCWVKFTDQELSSWVASFSKNWSEYPNEIITIHTELYFIIAFGNGYLINPNRRKLIEPQIIKGITSAIFDNAGKEVYFTNSSDLKKIDINGNVSVVLNNYFFDEINLKQITEGKLHAEYWYYQRTKKPFYIEIDLLTKEVKDSFYNKK
jgi:hypothetical protein